MTSGCQSNISSPLLIVRVFALTVSCYWVGLFKLFTAVWKGRGQHPGALSGTAEGSRCASSQDLDSLAALAAQTLPYMVRPCAGKELLSPCFNYMESNIAGMLGTGSLLKERKESGLQSRLPSLASKSQSCFILTLSLDKRKW